MILRAALLALGLAAATPAHAQQALPPFELGLRLMEAGEPALALKAFNRAIAADGVTAETLSGAAAAYYRIGQAAKAMQLARSAADLAPNLALARNNLGVMLYDSGDHAGALAEFERAFALTSGLDRTIATNLGIAETTVTQRNETVAAEQGDWDVIRFGHGVYRIEPRRPEATPAPAAEEDPT